MAFTEAFKLSSDDDFLGGLCEWMNETALKFTADSPEKNARMN